MRKWMVIAAPYVWLLLFFLIPFFIVFKISLSESEISIPPYTPVFSLSEGWESISTKLGQLDFEKYAFIFSDELYTSSYWSSLKIAAVATFLTLLIAYPLAYGMARAPKEWQPTLMMFVILPFWTSFLIRVYAWIGILKNEGLLNAFLLHIGAISEPLQIMNTTTAVYIGIVYSYLPFMVLPLYASLEKIDGRLLEAAEDLGSPPWKAFWQVTFPLSIPGIVAGCFLVFIPATGEFVIPDLLGGSETLMIGKTLWSEFFNNRDWPVASAVAVLLLLVLIVPIVAFQWAQQRAREAGR
ncbi:MAG: putrescine/spermidine ABC transporter permease [Hyphomicrobium sp. 32-62-53]|nr:MAG: putrescine/spermidine ABC transporter permease [Hyphomicrobium sp. 12-62-95]OYY00324.1 MAG: putrescine/spermidine ABC transporter permease [Hyphomicrobium sp. 32-62-53]